MLRYGSPETISIWLDIKKALKCAVSTIVETLKKDGTRAMRDEFSLFRQAVPERWQNLVEEFFVSAIGINKKTVRSYVQMFGEEDAGQVQLEL